MKTTAVTGMLLLIMSGLLSPAFAVEYATDVLERGNPGGWSESLKTFDEQWAIGDGNSVAVDIWVNDLPEELITAGFSIEYDASLVSITACDVYDGSLPGYWDGDMTTVVANPSGSSRCVVIVGNLGCVAPDAGGDIPLARITFKAASPGEATVTVRPVPDFDTIVGCGSTVYDPAIAPHLIVLSVSEGGQCVSEALYGEYGEETRLLRTFRDNVLNKTTCGRQIIKQYYEWSPVIVSTMKRDEKCKEDVKSIIDAILPMVKMLAQ